MKSKLLATAASGALTVGVILFAPAAAFADGGIQSNQVKGTFTVGGGYLGYESTNDADEGDAVVHGNASAVVNFAAAWSGQVDLFGEQVVVADDVSEDQYSHLQGFGLHINRRWPGTGQVGVFAGYGQGGYAGGEGGADDEFWSGGWVGVEGLIWLNDFTLGAQAATLDIGDHGGEGTGFVNDAYLLRGFVRYFFNPDVMGMLDLSAVEGDDIDGDGDGDGYEWAALIMARLADAPIYGSLAYRDGEYEEQWCSSCSGSSQGEIGMFTVSLTYLFGTNSLRENDHNGVTIDSPTTQLRASGVQAELD